MKINDILKQFPDFEQWVKDKKLDFSGLSLLTEFSDTQKPQALLNWISQNRPSHSQGIQILELAGELLLMGRPLNAILETAQNSEDLLRSLKQLRYPLTSGQEEKKTKIVRALPWPKHMKGRWIRQNDKTGLEVQFQCFSMKEFKQKAQSLQHIINEIEEKGNSLWNS